MKQTLKFFFLLTCLIHLFIFIVRAQHLLPDSLYSGKQGPFHVQGVAIDHTNGFAYFSFTDKLVKTDLSGKLIGSVTGFSGHLGDLDFDPETGRLYASLEYKNDAIGQGINKTLGIERKESFGFYIAVIETSLITKPNMNAEIENLLQTVYLREAADDYQSTVSVGKRKISHSFGCS